MSYATRRIRAASERGRRMAKRRWALDHARREALAGKDPAFTGLRIVRRIIVIDRECVAREAVIYESDSARFNLGESERFHVFEVTESGEVIHRAAQSTRALAETYMDDNRVCVYSRAAMDNEDAMFWKLRFEAMELEHARILAERDALKAECVAHEQARASMHESLKVAGQIQDKLKAEVATLRAALEESLRAMVAARTLGMQEWICDSIAQARTALAEGSK
jgi:hypothetical protein